MPPPQILVVGAGPAGISASEVLAGAKASVTLLDKSVSSDKACGGGITKSYWRVVGVDQKSKSDSAKIITKIYVNSSMIKACVKKKDGILAVIDRVSWIKEKIEKLKKMGVTVKLGQRFIGLQGSNEALTNRGKIKFDYLVACDGAVSCIRRQLGLTAQFCIKALQITCDKKKIQGNFKLKNTGIIFNPMRFGPGYAWIFHGQDDVRIGCGIPSFAFKKKTGLKKAFYELLLHLDMRKEDGKVSSGSIGCDYAGHRFSNIFLGGDAAGMASPLTGEGIGPALISGREIAKEILNPGYHSHVVPKLAARHRRTVQALLEPFMHQALYSFSPAFLKIPIVRKEVMKRYML